MKRKQFDIEIQERRENGGRIRINTGAVDRDRDRVLPSGAQIENYMKNPVVQWGHNYYEPWSTIGKTNELIFDADGIEADFDLRPAANEHDPQNIVRLLWNGGWIKAASIGFDPRGQPPSADDATGDNGDNDPGMTLGVEIGYSKTWVENEFGGYDFPEWELLEWSLVPIPANQEALRRMAKSFDMALEIPASRSETPEPEQPDVNDSVDPGVAWVRRLTVENNMGFEQILLACFHGKSIDIPADATKLDFDDEGEIVEVPHPDAGKTVRLKNVDFIPPIEFYNEKWDNNDAVYSTGGQTAPDEEFVKAWRDEWDVKELSDVLLVLPYHPTKAAFNGYVTHGFDVCKLTHRTISIVKRLMKRRLGNMNDQTETAPTSEELDALRYELQRLELTIQSGNIKQQLENLRGALK